MVCVLCQFIQVEEYSQELDEGPELFLGAEDDLLLEVGSNPSLPATAHVSFETDKLVRLYVLFVLMFQTISRSFDAAIGVHLFFFSTILGTIGRHLHLESLQRFA